jgi:hypothetical protein
MYMYWCASIVCIPTPQNSQIIDISLTSGALFPYAYYQVTVLTISPTRTLTSLQIGQTIILPISFHSAIALIVSILVFPQSVSALFTTCLQGVVASLSTAISLHKSHLLEDVTSSAFTHTQITNAVNKAEGALPTLAAAARLLKIDLVYARFAPTDYAELHRIVRKLTVRADGMGVYYTLIDPTRERFPVTPAASRPATPSSETPMHSRRPSPLRDRKSSRAPAEKHVPPIDQELRDRRQSRPHRRPSPRPRPFPVGLNSPLHSKHKHSHSYHSHHTLLHSSLLHLALSRVPKPSEETAVGVFESQRYLDLEATHLSHPDSTRYTAKATELLSTSCQDLLSVCEEALGSSGAWMGSVRKYRFDFWRRSHEDRVQLHKEEVEKYKDLLGKLTVELDEFTTKKRYVGIVSAFVTFVPEPRQVECLRPVSSDI